MLSSQISAPNSLEEIVISKQDVRVTQTDEPPLLTFQLCGTICRSWLCNDCFPRLAEQQRKRWLPAVAEFGNILMITLTIDPSLFADPKAAFVYVREKKCVPLLLTKLLRLPRGEARVHSRRYVYRTEFQNNGMFHCHVLVDASYINHAKLTQLWASLRPKSLTKGPRPIDTTGFGHVYVKQFGRAAAAAVNYLVKFPIPRWPDFLLDMGGAGGRFRAFGESKGLLPPRRKKPPAGPYAIPKRPRAKMSSARTHRERINDCCTSTKLLRIESKINRDTGELIIEPWWEASLPIPCSIARMQVGATSGGRFQATSVDAAIEQLGPILDDGPSERRLPACNQAAMPISAYEVLGTSSDHPF